MNLEQMKTLVPLIEDVAAEMPPALKNLNVVEGEPVLNNVIPFAVHGRYMWVTWVLNNAGQVQFSYEAR